MSLSIRSCLWGPEPSKGSVGPYSLDGAWRSKQDSPTKKGVPHHKNNHKQIT